MTVTSASDHQQLVDQVVLPLLIGVTGHRDIPPEDIPGLKDLVRTIIDQIKSEYPTTPLMLMSALADGADRLAAEVALDAGVALIASLPMNQEIYEQDFSADSINQFQKLLKHAAFTYELPIENKNSKKSVNVGDTARDFQYLAVGRFIVKHCQVLIALWDGVTDGPTGGTSQVVRMQLEGVDPLCSDGSELFSALPTGPVYFVPTRRSTYSEVAQDTEFLKRHLRNFDGLENVQIMYPLSDDGKSTRDEEHMRTLSCVERFNRDSNQSRQLTHFEFGRKQAASYLIAEDSASIIRSDLSLPAQCLLNCYAHTDCLAQQFQKKTYNVLLLLASLVPFIVFFFETYSNVTTALIAISGYLLFLGLAYGLYFVTRHQGNQEKFLDYRALAEGLRVCFFWRLAGIRKDSASFYLNKQQSELDWISYAIRTWNLLAYRGSVDPATSQMIDTVKKNWLEDQKKYFERNAQNHKSHADYLNRLAAFFFRLGFFAVTPAMLIIHGMKLGGERLDPWMQVATPLTFVIAGSLKFYSEQMLYAEQAKQYARMYAVFTKSIQLLDAAGEDQLLRQEIIFAVGKEALAENGEWVLMHRERPIEVPQG